MAVPQNVRGFFFRFLGGETTGYRIFQFFLDQDARAPPGTLVDSSPIVQ